MADIEIGMNVSAKLYLTVRGAPLSTAFDRNQILAVEEDEEGAVIVCSAASSGVKYRVPIQETKADVDRAIKDADEYKAAAISTIQSMLD